MMFGIPRVPFLLALAGALPFVWGAVTLMVPSLATMTVETFGARFIGPYIHVPYGTIILAFMSGVLWGFAAKGNYVMGYFLSVVPALWAFFMPGNGPAEAGMNLLVGFLAVLLLDWHFSSVGLTPKWWFRMRCIVTAIVVIGFIPVVV